MSLPEAGSWKCWVLASRPRTLFAAVAPVALGTALAGAGGRAALWPAAAALLGAVSIQIGTNLANDFWDARKGTDTKDRLGPVRVTSSGLIPAAQVLVGAWVFFGIAVLSGIYLTLVAGWPVVAIGIISILCGFAYTAGPLPLAYVGLGDLFSFFFFGLVATAGSFFVQTGEWSFSVLIAGVMPGLYSVVLLALNNLRDVEQDRKANKRTLAVRFGEGFVRAEIAVCLTGAGVVPVLMQAAGALLGWPGTGVAAVVGLGFAAVVMARIWSARSPRDLNALFPLTGRASMVMTAVVAYFLLR